MGFIPGLEKPSRSTAVGESDMSLILQVRYSPGLRSRTRREMVTTGASSSSEGIWFSSLKNRIIREISCGVLTCD